MTAPDDLDSNKHLEEPLQLDPQGVPILADVVIRGEELRATGIVLPKPPAGSTAQLDSKLDLERKIQAAIEAALPKVTERTAATMRRALFKEVQDHLDLPLESQADSEHGATDDKSASPQLSADS